MSGRGAERVLDLIEWLAERTAPAGLADTAQSLRLPKSSALLLLRTLVNRNYAVRDADGRYRLIRLPGEASANRLAWGTILRIAEPPLHHAVETVEETGCVAVLTPERRVHYLKKILPKREIRYDRDISQDRIAHHVASGIVLLGGLSDEDFDAYLAGTAEHGDAPKDVSERVVKARSDGYAVNLVGRIEGAAGVAAPVFSADGRMVAAMNISGPKDRFTKHLDRCVSAVVQAAQRVSDELSWRFANHKSPSEE